MLDFETPTYITAKESQQMQSGVSAAEHITQPRHHPRAQPAHPHTARRLPSNRGGHSTQNAIHKSFPSQKSRASVF